MGKPERNNMIKFNFTKGNIEALEAPIKGRVVYQDTKDSYLHLRVAPNKTSFYFIKKFKGKPKYILIGDYPEMTPPLARKISVKHYASLSMGIDPIDEKRQAETQMTLDELFAEYAIAKDGIKKSLKNNKAMMKSSLKSLAKTPLENISFDKVRRLHKKMIKTPYQANRTIFLLSALFKYAKKDLKLNIDNPCTGQKKYTEHPKSRILNKKDPEELNRFYDICDKWQQHANRKIYADLFLTMLYTGQRKTNVLNMKFDDINLFEGEWTIRPEETKNGEPHTLQLADEAIVILKRRFDSIGKTSKFVFPSTVYPERPFVEIKKIWKVFLGEAKIENFTLHDIRRSCGSMLLGVGKNLKLVQEHLGHKEITTTARAYAYVLDEEKEKVLNKAFKRD